MGVVDLVVLHRLLRGRRAKKGRRGKKCTPDKILATPMDGIRAGFSLSRALFRKKCMDLSLIYESPAYS